MNYFVYILYCSVTDKSYVGQTDNLILRYYRHRDGKSKWTSQMKKPFLLHWEGFDTRSEAMKREKYYKAGRGYSKRKRIVSKYLSNFPAQE
jgi:putative endonuclease